MLDDRLKDLEILFWIASDLRGVAFREGRVSGRLMYPGLSGALGRLVSAGLVKKIDMEHTASRDHYRVTKAGEVFVRSARECYAEHIRGKADLRELEVL
ncbi:hypothetical protein KY362_00790, partial [Candidatus Woesearchaeota archaeon]|nr:hypothetical protein [Candidatus Woesearchaeota archaeon]